MDWFPKPQGGAFTTASASSSENPSEPPDFATVFARADADGDGTVTAAELASDFETNASGAHAAPDFDRLVGHLDQDGDGALSLEEMQACPPPPPPRDHGAAAVTSSTQMFNALDTDGDGSISLAEWTAGTTSSDSGEDTGTSTALADLSSVFDSDEDGSLSQGEYGSMLTQIHQLLAHLRGLPDKSSEDSVTATAATELA